MGKENRASRSSKGFMNILIALSKLKRSPRMAGIRKFTNLLYYDPEYVNLKLSNYDVIEVDGYKYYVTDQINAIQRVKGNPWFDEIKASDVFVDIGANIGAMTIPFAKVARRAVAVEPIYYRELENNVDLNVLNNVKILPFGIGKRPKSLRSLRKFEFSEKIATSPIITFEELKREIGEPIDFLKMDGEGCEWDIEPEELKGIRELRIEFHIARDNIKECKRKYQKYLDWMKESGYEVTINDIDIGPNPYFIEDPEVSASLR